MSFGSLCWFEVYGKIVFVLFFFIRFWFFVDFEGFCGVLGLVMFEGWFFFLIKLEVDEISCFGFFFVFLYVLNC